MIQRLSLRQKMLFSICGIVLLAFVAIVSYITLASSRNAEIEASQLAVEIGYR